MSGRLQFLTAAWTVFTYENRGIHCENAQQEWFRLQLKVIYFAAMARRQAD